GGVFKSTDGGTTWSPTGLTYGGVALAIDPTTPSALYAATGSSDIGVSGVSKSTDGGATWSPAGLTNTEVIALAIDPTTPSTLYAGGAGVFKSTDGASSWSPAYTGLPPTGTSTVFALVIDP